MKLLTKKQKTVLKLYARGKKVTKIAQETRFSRNSIYYALKTGKKRLDEAVEVIEFALRKKLLAKNQITKLKRALKNIS